MDGGRGRPSHFPQEYGDRGRGRVYEQQGLPDHNTMFPPGMGGVNHHPQYNATAQFGMQDAHLRHQLELQHDMELRRRFAEGQQGPHHLVEYPNNLQQIHEAQAQQEFMRHHHQLQQQEEQAFRELIAQNPDLMHQYQASHNEAVMASLQNELFQQERNRLVHDQLQQELQRQMSPDTHQRENAELFAMLHQQRGADVQRQEPSSQELAAELMSQHPQPSRTPTELHQGINQAAPSSAPTSFNPQEGDTFRSHAGQTAIANGTADVGDSSEEQDPARLFSIKKLHDQRHHGDHAESTTRTYYDEHNGTLHAVQSQIERPESGRGVMLPSKSSSNKTPSPKVKDAKVKSKGHGKSKKKTDSTKKPKKKRRVEDDARDSPSRKRKTSAAKAKRNGNETRDSPEKGSSHSRNGIERSKTDHPTDDQATSRETPVAANAPSTAGSEGRARNDDEAFSIVSSLRDVVVTESEVEKVAEWSNQDLRGRSLQGDLPDLGPFYSFHLPLLPVEPEDPGGASAKDPIVFRMLPPMRDGFAMNSRGNSSWTPKGVASQKAIRAPSENVKQDTWWPSKEDIAEERRRRGLAEVSTEQGPTDGRLTFERTGLTEAKQRLSSSKEPGVIEKLPHCVLYEKHFKKEKGGRFQPKFCCQTTEAFPFEPMVCCSVCSTWRHAQCGGHYKRHTARSVDKCQPVFQPVCDRCVLERRVLAEGGHKQAEERLEKQRVKHLRRTCASNAVMRQAAFNKHSGQYKWPLGCVTVSHVAGHTRSVQSRHEKAERQWHDMVKKLSGEYKKDGMNPKEKLKVRTREFEKLLAHIEDAEGVTDRHNMTLFLERDSGKPHPAGFEVTRRNIFDPEDDALAGDGGAHVHDIFPNEKKLEMPSDVVLTDSRWDSDVCAKPGCGKRPRFDSIFCSDSCGVSTLETDLLKSIRFASTIHPSSLRS
mmetsp:Transcript_32819/g.78395  ORF Transcript_32819/g.78395 Transcript_32819/m.78395 type:complete len:934 (+) Transcript_32819:358-3159(+)